MSDTPPKEPGNTPVLYWTGRIQPSRAKYMAGHPNPDASVAWPDDEGRGMIDGLGELSRNEKKYGRVSLEHISHDCGSLMAMWLDKDMDTWGAGIVSDPKSVTHLQQAIASNQAQGKKLYGISPMQAHLEVEDRDGRVVKTHTFSLHHVALVEEPDMANFDTYVDYATTDGKAFVGHLMKRYESGEMSYVSKEDRRALEMGQTCERAVMACRTQVDDGVFKAVDPAEATTTWAVTLASKDGVGGKLEQSHIGRLILESGYFPLDATRTKLRIPLPVQSVASVGSTPSSEVAPTIPDVVMTEAQPLPPGLAQAQEQILTPLQNAAILSSTTTGPGAQAATQPRVSLEPNTFARQANMSASSGTVDPDAMDTSVGNSTTQTPPPSNPVVSPTGGNTTSSNPTNTATTSDAMEVDTPALGEVDRRTTIEQVGDTGRQQGTTKRKQQEVPGEREPQPKRAATEPSELELLKKQIAALQSQLQTAGQQAQEAKPNNGVQTQQATTPNQPTPPHPATPNPPQSTTQQAAPLEDYDNKVLSIIKGLDQDRTSALEEKKRALQEAERVRKEADDKLTAVNAQLADYQKRMQSMEPVLKHYQDIQQRRQQEEQEEKSQLDLEFEARKRAAADILNGEMGAIEPHIAQYNSATTAASKRKIFDTMQNAATLDAAWKSNPERPSKEYADMCFRDRFQHHLNELKHAVPAGNVGALTSKTGSTPAPASAAASTQSHSTSQVATLSGAPGSGSGSGNNGAQDYMDTTPTRSQLQARYDAQQKPRAGPLTPWIDDSTPEGRQELLRRSVALSSARVPLDQVNKLAAQIAQVIIVPNITRANVSHDPRTGALITTPMGRASLAEVVAARGGARLDLCLAAQGTSPQTLHNMQEALSKTATPAAAPQGLNGAGARLSAASAGGARSGEGATMTVLEAGLDSLTKQVQELNLTRSASAAKVAASRTGGASNPYAMQSMYPQPSVASAPLNPQFEQYLEALKATPASALLTPEVARTMVAKVGASAVQRTGVNPFFEPLKSMDEESLLAPMLVAFGVANAMTIASKLNKSDTAQEVLSNREGYLQAYDLKRSSTGDGVAYEGFGENSGVSNRGDLRTIESLVGKPLPSMYNAWDSARPSERGTWIPTDFQMEFSKYM